MIIEMEVVALERQRPPGRVQVIAEKEDRLHEYGSIHSITYTTSKYPPMIGDILIVEILQKEECLPKREPRPAKMSGDS